MAGGVMWSEERVQFRSLDSKECEHKSSVRFFAMFFKGHHCKHNWGLKAEGQ